MLGFADGPQEGRQELEDLLGTHARDQREAARNPLRVEPLTQLERLVRRRRRPQLDPEWVVDAREELDVGFAGVARALADPEHVAGAAVPVAGRRVAPGERLLVVEDETLVTRPDVDLMELGLGSDVDATRGHEAERALDLGRKLLVAAPLG
jgi:hypothetical protein